MSSDGWELVGRNKKEKTNGKPAKLTKAEKKKFIENTPKVEDFLPLTQVKTLYENFDNNDDESGKKKQKEKKVKEKQEPKKQQKQKQSSTEKTKQKAKQPKSIQEALHMIDVAELNEVLGMSYLRFPDAPSLWLRDLAAYLNAKIPIDKEDQVFSGKPKDYPLNLVPKDISAVLERTIDMAGERNTQLFYENTLTTMSTDIVKSVPVVGYKIFLQLIALSNPAMTAANIPKLISIRNSYQNRKPVGQSLLWVMSQAGRKNLGVGLKLWHEVMAPMLEAKNYANYVVQILSDLVFEHEDFNDLSPDLYLDIVEDTYTSKYNIPTALATDITSSITILRSILFKNNSISYSKLFEMLMGKITPKVHPSYRDELIKALVACLSKDPLCISIWSSLYVNNSPQAHLLLNHINSKCEELGTKLKSRLMEGSRVSYLMTNERWRKVRDENLAQNCSKLTKTIQTKMTACNKKKGKFPWGKGAIILLVLISAIVVYDIRKHGSFEESSIDRFLKRSGVCMYGHKAWLLTKQYTANGLEVLESSFPDYYKAVVDTCKPFVKLTGDVCLLTRNLSVKVYDNALEYAKVKGPVVLDTVEYYVPGMMELIQLRSAQGLELGKQYLSFFAEKVSEHSAASIRWLEHNIFVGKLSPGNLQIYATQAIDTTQSLASQTYDWVYEKVQTFSKVP